MSNAQLEQTIKIGRKKVDVFACAGRSSFKIWADHKKLSMFWIVHRAPYTFLEDVHKVVIQRCAELTVDKAISEQLTKLPKGGEYFKYTRQIYWTNNKVSAIISYDDKSVSDSQAQDLAVQVLNLFLENGFHTEMYKAIYTK